MAEKISPLSKQAKTYTHIFDRLNEELFDSQLPDVMCTFSRNKNIVGGYYSPDKWEDEDGKLLGEIAINANLMRVQEPQELYNTLVHEMVHFWQKEFGAPSRNGYHNQEWADKCKEIGLQPITEDGKETGQAVDTQFINGGKAELVIADMLTKEEFQWPYYADHLMVDPGGEPRPQNPDEQKEGPKQPAPEKKPRSGARTKYTCAVCGLNAWAKYGASLICGTCNRPLVAQK